MQTTLILIRSVMEEQKQQENDSWNSTHRGFMCIGRVCVHYRMVIGVFIIITHYQYYPVKLCLLFCRLHVWIFCLLLAKKKDFEEDPCFL